MSKLQMNFKPKIRCVDCGFFGLREGGIGKDGVTYINNSFWEIHDDKRKEMEGGDFYVSFSPEGDV